MKLTKKTIIIIASAVLLVAMLTVFLSVKALWPRALKTAVFDCGTCCDKGEIKCNTCNGKVDYDCRADGCYGNGQRICTVCNAKGAVVCTQCHGTGKISDNTGHSYICYPCSGTGKIECPPSVACECDKGTVHCDQCNDGKVDCPDC